MNRLVSFEIGFSGFYRFIFDVEEATFDWPAYLLGDQPILSHDTNDDSLNNDDQVDTTFIEHETNDEMEMESKPIDLIEQQN